MWAGKGQREEGDTESEADFRLRAVSTEPNAGLEPMNHEMMTWAEVGRLTDWITQEQPPENKYFNKNKYLKDGIWDSKIRNFGSPPYISDTYVHNQHILKAYHYKLNI